VNIGFLHIFQKLSYRLIFWVGLILLVIISAWAYFDIRYQKEKAISHVVCQTDRLSNTIMLGTQYGMMLHARDDINQIIKNIGKQKGIEAIRIYNKLGEIKYSIRPGEVDQRTNIKAEACYICHMTKPPLESLELDARKRVFRGPNGVPLLGIIGPIYNEKGCSTDPCHVHPQGKKVLGALDVVVSLDDLEGEIRSTEAGIIALAVMVFIGASSIIGFFLVRFVNRPIRALIEGIRHLAQGDYDYQVQIRRDDEIGQLARAVNDMGRQIGAKQEELNRQRDEYQTLFEHVPCYITVQDRELRLLRYNQEFAREFMPEVGDYCFKAYKGRTEPCPVCPVIMTFNDGDSHFSEETGVGKDGSETHWLVTTAPFKDKDGNVVGAMEMSLDITQLKVLEKEWKRSEEKYRTIFNTIPNPVFVVSQKDLQIMDCNDSVTAVYGFKKDKILDTPFLNLFLENERQTYAHAFRTARTLENVRHVTADGRAIYVNIRSSPSDSLGQPVWLVTTSDITKRLTAEQQLIQASKMATLGEMATGIAHELNQPLSVMKTASSFLIRKVKKREPIQEDILTTLAEEIDSHVDRASKIINHMREFGRKSEVKKERVQVNEPLMNALDIFSQQLKLREIHVRTELQEHLPPILADANRVEQVFINLLINARDAIEEKWESARPEGETKEILLRTQSEDGLVVVEIRDTGTGIPKAILDKIFEPFFTTKKVGKGTGLGLSITYGIVHDYDGTIKVHTEEGKGSSFIIQFRAAGEGDDTKSSLGG
jgi:histidine kinase